MDKDKAKILQSKYLELHDLLMKANPGVNIEKARMLRNAVIEVLEEPYQNRFKKLNLFEPLGIVNYPNVIKATVLFKDQLYKYSHDDSTVESSKILKLLRARECDNEFEESLAIMIVGDNDKFPYRSSYYITQFFQQLGFNETHDGSTRRTWTAEILKQYCIEDIYKIVAQGLFRKRYFLDAKKDINIALDDFKQMLKYCYSANEVYDIVSAFDLNINTDLLFKEQCKSTDTTLNELIDISIEFYTKKDFQTATEKIWDALERSKTILNPEDKKDSVSNLCKKCAVDLEEIFFNNEYKTLTEIGNKYQIRHFETNKTKIEDIDTLKYLYFRAFVLVNYAIKKLGIGKN